MDDPKVLTWATMRDGDWWVAQCLDYDLATQARTLDEMHDEVQRMTAAHVHTCREEGCDPWRMPTPNRVVAQFAYAPVGFRVVIADAVKAWEP